MRPSNLPPDTRHCTTNYIKCLVPSAGLTPDPPSAMPLLGAHQSIAGGYYRAVEIAAEIGCDCVQLFTKNNNQWRAKDLTDEDAIKFQAALKQHGLGYPMAHDSYLINLAAPDEELWRKSVEEFAVELLR